MSMADGLKIQARDIDQWGHILNTRTLEKLKAEAIKRNAEIKEEWGDSGFDVWRGSSINDWLCNEARRLVFQAQQKGTP